MEITVIEETKNKIVPYKIDHPLIGEPEMIIETNGKVSPKAAIKKAIKKLSNDADKLKKSAAKELK